MKFWKWLDKLFKCVNGTKGVISLFLCIILVPVMTISMASIELFRYQSARQTVADAVDTSTLSTLAYYDEYLEKRFGLFAIDQNFNTLETFKEYLEHNMKVLGKAADSVESQSAALNYPLTEDNVLKSQLLDFSESTVLAETLLDGLNLEELLAKLDNLCDLSKIVDAAEKMKTLTGTLKDMVESGKDLLDSVNTAKSKITGLNDHIKDLADAIKKLYTAIGDTEINLTDNDDSDLIEILQKSGIKGKITAVKNAANDIKSDINGIKGAIDSIKTDLSNFKTDISTAKTQLQSSKTATKAAAQEVKDAGGSMDAGKQTDSSEALINDLESSLSGIGEDALNSLKSACSDFVNTFKDKLGLDLDNFKSSDFDITTDSDGNLQLKPNAKSIMTKLLSLYDYWHQHKNDSNIKDLLVRKIKDLVIPEGIRNGNIFTTISNAFKNALDAAEQQFVNNIKNALTGTLNKLVSVLKSLFDMDFLYDAKLCATIKDSIYGQGDPDNPWQNLLNSMSDLISAINSFTEGGDNLYEIICNWIDGLGRLFDSVVESFNAIKNLAGNLITQVETWIGYLADPSQLYQALLIAAYMAYNLPNRTNALTQKYVFDKNNNLNVSVPLGGSALTGFAYNNILRPQKPAGTGIAGFEAIKNFTSAAINGGNDDTFIGAELEYILAGTKSEIMNQAVGFFAVYFLRLLIDIPSILTNSQVTEMAGAATIACWVVYLIVILAEPLCDTLILVNGGEEPIYKRTCYITPTGVLKLIEDLSGIAIENSNARSIVENNIKNQLSGLASGGSGGGNNAGGGSDIFSMDYKIHCLIMLMLQNNTETIMKRYRDLIKFESMYFYKSKGQTFNINKTYTSITTDSRLKLSAFFKVKGINDSGPITFPFKYSRGY